MTVPHAEPGPVTTLPKTVRLRDGRSCLIRLIAPGDADRLQHFVRGLSEESAHQRFFAAIHQLSPAQLQRFTASSDPMDFAVIALARNLNRDLDFESADAPIAGTARCLRASAADSHGNGTSGASSGAKAVEFAVTIADAWQGAGLGRLLLTELIALARQRGVGVIQGEALSENTRMLDLARRLGFTVRADPTDARASLLRLKLSPEANLVRRPDGSG